METPTCSTKCDAWHPPVPSRSAPRRGAPTSGNAQPPAEPKCSDAPEGNAGAGRSLSASYDLFGRPALDDPTPVPLDTYADGWAAGIRAMQLHPDRLDAFLQGIRDAIRETKNRKSANEREGSR